MIYDQYVINQNITQKKSTSVESVFNLNDQSIKWYPLKKYISYEATCINNSLIFVRSFKSPHKYPYGILLKSNKKGNYILTDKDNQRIELTPENIYNIMDKTNPRLTIEVEQFKARNNRAFINPSNDKENIVRNPKPIRKKQLEEKLSFPSFSGLIMKSEDL